MRSEIGSRGSETVRGSGNPIKTTPLGETPTAPDPLPITAVGLRRPQLRGNRVGAKQKLIGSRGADDHDERRGCPALHSSQPAGQLTSPSSCTSGSKTTPKRS